ncbi:MAG: bifunctional 4-hydroxy-2-oxoglutarate aldolase/2-dehydro-3-deoxy-phosphogluconate aldolase [Chthoniobacteraceae bacterium]
MNKTDLVQRLLDPGVIGILRADSATRLVDAIRALAAGGITALEVTMTTPSALDVIAEARKTSGDRFAIGVGSVLDAETARQAMIAGAQFVVTPVVRPDVIRICNRYGVPIACGATTPTEALTAHELGSDFIKIFPADHLGHAYIRTILAPLPMLRIIPTGGVTPENVADFFAAGCVAVGAGSTLLQRDALEAGAWDRVTARAAQFVTAARKARRT